MSHGDIDALGFLLEIGGKRLAYSGDTGFCDELVDMVSQADTAVVELATPEGGFSGHMSMRDVLDLREKVGKEVNLIVTHLDNVDDEKKRILQDAGIIVAEDGNVLDI